ncbi:DMT family transporter [Aliiroseovarius subalbicans]|uniref:DMT family transporter n=1 Tax=Aliiroseovarius subalbicans TaxID=2925840 RepID=UPI001F57234A|nr:DMT family transporter [Aliiroseovarius subalbicans]MCI2399532.1 DMT family transporter [Aliiroseovarius subalbicans]
MNNLRGAAWMVASMAGFAVEDMLIKLAAIRLPVGQVIVTFGLGGTLVFALLALRAGQPVWHDAIRSRAMALRSVSEVIGRLFFALAITMTPLSSASAILQATPLVVALGAVVFFGEQVGWRRWAAIALGFVGVLMILRPGLAGFEALSMLAVIAMFGFAGRDLGSRAAPVGMSNLQLGVLGFVMLTLSGALILGVTGGAVYPDLREAALLAGIVAVGVFAYFALTKAMRTGDISVVAPFRYSRLVLAMVLAVVVFGERPDGWTLAGSVVIVLSGLVLIKRS